MNCQSSRRIHSTYTFDAIQHNKFCRGNFSNLRYENFILNEKKNGTDYDTLSCRKQIPNYIRSLTTKELYTFVSNLQQLEIVLYDGSILKYCNSRGQVPQQQTSTPRYKDSANYLNSIISISVLNERSVIHTRVNAYYTYITSTVPPIAFKHNEHTPQKLSSHHSLAVNFATIIIVLNSSKSHLVYFYQFSSIQTWTTRKTFSSSV